VKIIKNPLFWSGTKNQVSSGFTGIAGGLITVAGPDFATPGGGTGFAGAGI
jgi:hypothetical protein